MNIFARFHFVDSLLYLRTKKRNIFIQ